jgi:hypothetical protein
VQDKSINQITGTCIIDGEFVNFLVDTGCPYSILHEKCLRFRGEIRPINIAVEAANGSPIDVIGLRTCNIQIGDSIRQTEVIVSSNLCVDLILGMDLLTTHPDSKQFIAGLNDSINQGTNKIIDSTFQECVDKLRKDVFYELDRVSSAGLSTLGTTKVLSHIIRIGGADPIKQRARPIPYHYQQEFKRLITEMIKSGMIRESESPWCSPVHLVKKKDGSLRITVDYRKLNDVTTKDSYPIPRIDDMLNKLAKAKIFTTLDLASGYYQVEMEEASKKYTAFSCDMGLFEYNVMPMGLTNACATFQRLMNRILSSILGAFCLVYLDDIIIFSENVDNHLEHVKAIIDLLQRYNLKIKPSKCKIAEERVEYLSHIIFRGTITPGKAKTEALYQFVIPRNVKQIQSFLGLASYYRKYILNFSTIASPLIRCTEKGVKFHWTLDCQIAFDRLRETLSGEPLLRLPNMDKEFCVEADASNFGVGAVLSQEYDKIWQPIAYFSKHLSKTQRNYSTSERELLAIVLAVEHFRQFLYGRVFRVLTDHQPLRSFLTMTDPSPRLARWLGRVNLFEFVIEYRKGKNHGNADALSRMADATNEDSSPENSLIIVNAIHLRGLYSNEQSKDADIKWIIDLKKSAKTDGSKRPSDVECINDFRKSLLAQWNRLIDFGQNLFREWTHADGSSRFQYVVPTHQRRTLLEQAHNSVSCGHLGSEKTYERLVFRCYWPKLRDDVAKFVSACVACQQIKPPLRYNKAELVPIFPNRPMELITTDMMGPLKKTAKGFAYIMVVCDHYTKWVEAYPMRSLTANEAAQRLAQFIFRYGIPETILSDQGTNFQSQVRVELWGLLDIRRA